MQPSIGSKGPGKKKNTGGRKLGFRVRKNRGSGWLPRQPGRKRGMGKKGNGGNKMSNMFK